MHSKVGPALGRNYFTPHRFWRHLYRHKTRTKRRTTRFNQQEKAIALFFFIPNFRVFRVFRGSQFADMTL